LAFKRRSRVEGPFKDPPNWTLFWLDGTFSTDSLAFGGDSTGAG